MLAVCFGCDTEANGGDGARRSRLGGGKLPARNRVVSLTRAENSAPRRRQCWWMTVERDKRGFEGLEGSIFFFFFEVERGQRVEESLIFIKVS